MPIKQPKKGGSQIVKFSTMAIEMIAIIVAFTFGGRYLDNYLQFKFPLFTLLLSLTGIGIALYQVLRRL